MCEILAIMHNSRFVEFGVSKDIYKNPQHIYTRRLIASIPDTDPDKKGPNAELRNKINKEYEERSSDYYQDGRKVYDLKKLSDTHYVAMP